LSDTEPRPAASCATARYNESVGRFDSLLEKMKDKRKELVRRAASKAASVALDGTTKAALGAVDSMGQAIEKAIFGDVLKSRDSTEDDGPAPEAPDPFAHLKEKERAEARAAAEKAQAQTRAEAKAKLDEDVDAELQALKKKLAK